MCRSQQCQKHCVLNVHSIDGTLRLAEREWLLGKSQNPLPFPHYAAFGVFPNQTQTGQRKLPEPVLDSFLLPHGSWRPNSSSQTGQQALLPTEFAVLLAQHRLYKCRG